MKPLPIILFLSFVIINFSCKHSEKGTYNYKELHFDTNTIAIFKWDSLQHVFPPYSGPLRLQQEDLTIVDSLLQDRINDFNKRFSEDPYLKFSHFTNYHPIDLSSYKRQYFPYGDNNFQRIVYIFCFSDHLGNWATEVHTHHRGEGSTALYIKINLYDNKVEEFQIGDFG